MLACFPKKLYSGILAKRGNVVVVGSYESYAGRGQVGYSR